MFREQRMVFVDYHGAPRAREAAGRVSACLSDCTRNAAPGFLGPSTQGCLGSCLVATLERTRSPEGDEAWEATLQRIYWVQADLAELLPDRSDGLVPNPPATADALERAERRLGRALPPSYRAFLSRFDGWPQFFDGATLLGAKDLGKSSYADLAQAAFEAAETPVPSGGPPSARVRGYPGDMIPFGIDPTGTTLFAFDPSTADERGEMGVVAWINEIGIRRESFHDFLQGILELCEADRDNALSSTPAPARQLLQAVDIRPPVTSACAG